MGILPDEVWTDWDKSGRAKLLKTLTAYFEEEEEDGSHPLDNGDCKPKKGVLTNTNYNQIHRIIYDLLWQGIKGKLTNVAVVNCMSELVSNNLEVANIIVDIIALADMETQVEDGKKDERGRLAAIVRGLHPHLSDGLVKERLDFDLMGESGIVRQPKKFFNTVIKLKTKLFYKQQKFNLFREESEGYAKLITELNGDLKGIRNEYMLNVIRSLIGYFNLDPNRVLDIILESFESQTDQFKFFIEILNAFLSDRDTLKELLHFKFSHFKNNEEEKDTPDSLYTLTAHLIQHDVLSLDDVYPWLNPDDSVLIGAWEKEQEEANEALRKIHIVSTNKSAEDEEKEKNKPRSENKHNQKIGLLAALFKCGSWELGEKMMETLPVDYCMSFPKVSNALSGLVHRTIDPVYHKMSGISDRVKSKHHLHRPGSIHPPVANTPQDLRNHVYPMLRALGPNAHRDPTLIIKIVRIFKSCLGIARTDSYELLSSTGDKLKDRTGNEFYFEIFSMLDEVFLPSLSLMESNCCLAEELWSLIRHFPYQHRYRLYDSWKGESMTTHPILIRTKTTTFKMIKEITKKMSKENVKHTGRKLGKLSHSCPGLIFSYVLKQIEVADNLIGPVVDSMKYMTNLSFDMLGFCIIESLNDPDKNRTKTDGTSISKWLSNLATFCGAVYKKYPIELTGLLQYVANQLKAKHSLDLLIVKEVVNKMGGIEAYEEMTPDQVEAMSGGELLRQEAGNFSQVKNTRKSSQRLKDCLMDMKMAVPLVLLMAQQGSCVVYQETEKDHLKLVGKLFDQCHDTLVQFGTFLANNLSQDDYTKIMPPLPQLLSQFYVNPDIAFFLARPMFNHLISTQFEEIRKADKHWKGKTSQEKQAKHAEAANIIMEPLTAAVIPVYPAKVWDDITPQFLATFWSLTMYDLYVPEKSYQKKIKQLKETQAKLPENKELNSSRRKRESERLSNLVDKLMEEEKRHKEHVERVMVRLKSEKDKWFLSRVAKTAKNETVTQLLQFCLFPRSIFTSSDASYAAKFVTIIHLLKTPNFSTLICFDRTFCDITYTVTACTENEASRYGRFLCAMLETARNWHKDKETFEKECSGYPGFITKFKAAGAEDAADRTQNAHTDTVDFENYRHVCHKWHYKIAKALVVCLESKDYVQIRNALIILNEIIAQYPLISNLASVLEKRIEKVCEEEKDKRRDLYIKARSYQGKLSLHKSRMVREHEFHIMKPKPETEPEKPKEKEKEKEDKSGEKNAEAEERRSEGRESKERQSESRERSSKSKDRSSEGRERGSKSRERGSESRERGSESRERGSESRERGSESMGPPASKSRKSVDPGDSDRDFKRKRDSGKEKAKSPVLDRLEKKEKLRKEKEKEKAKKDKEEKEAKEANAKKERKRDRDASSAETEKKRRKDDETGESSKRKSRR